MRWLGFYFKFCGRASRRDYWLKFILPLIVGWMIFHILLPWDAYAVPQGAIVYSADGYPVPSASFWKHMLQNPYVIFTFVLAYISLWCCLAVGAKRCHDRNKSGFFQIICFVPIVGPLWTLIELGLLPGTIGPNRFGPDPRRTSLERRNA